MQTIIKEYYERIKNLENAKWDLEYEVNKKDYEVSVNLNLHLHKYYLI